MKQRQREVGHNNSGLLAAAATKRDLLKKLQVCACQIHPITIVCHSDFSCVPKEEKRRLAALDAELADANDVEVAPGKYAQTGILSSRACTELINKTKQLTGKKLKANKI